MHQSPQVGSRMGDYEILDVLRSSKKEITFRVKNLVAGRIESMKVLPESLLKDPEALERFLREIKVHAKLLHPNIVTFYHAAMLDGVPVMTTELVEGTTLADRLELGPLPLAEGLNILRQVLNALGYAHSEHIVHREVTPDHIILLEKGVVKLAGFGLAKTQGDLSLTQEGTMLGSAAYMSPEQVKGKATLDGRTDLYAAAIVFFEIVTGRRPYHAASQFDLMLAHVQADPIPIASVNRNLPAALDLVMNRALSKNPAHRYQTAEELSAALQEASSVVRPAPAPAPAPRPYVQHAPAPAGPAAPTAALENRKFALLVVVMLALLAVWSLTLFSR